MAHSKHQRGLSLLEALLVLALIGAIVFYGLRQLYTFRQSANVMTVRDQVDLIFKAMTAYYKANCSGPEGGPWGTLSPYNSPQPDNPFPINIETDLIDTHYLIVPIANYPVVNTTGIGTMGFVAQFNLYETTRNFCTHKNSITRRCDQQYPIGTSYHWKAQVAVRIRDTAHKEEYLTFFRGDCLSTATTDGTVNPCSLNTPGDYVVWERNPSLSSLYGNSTSWLNNPGVHMFARYYRTYNVEYLIQSGGLTPDGEQQYFVCGD